jgi:hypothetical protein
MAYVIFGSAAGRQFHGDIEQMIYVANEQMVLGDYRAHTRDTVLHS